MTRLPDDSSLTPAQMAKVRAEAGRALKEAGVMGILPTPVDQILAVAQVEEVTEDVLSVTFLAGLRRKAGNSLKQAVSKVLGVFDAVSSLVFIDQLLLPVKSALYACMKPPMAFCLGNALCTGSWKIAISRLTLTPPHYLIARQMSSLRRSSFRTTPSTIMPQMNRSKFGHPSDLRSISMPRSIRPSGNMYQPAFPKYRRYSVWREGDSAIRIMKL